MTDLPTAAPLHVLMVSMDTAILSQRIGDTRRRHALYAEQIGRISMAVLNRRRVAALQPYRSDNVVAVPTNSRSYLHYLPDGLRTALELVGRDRVDLITSQDPFLTALIGLRLRGKLNAPLLVQDHSSFLTSPHFAAEAPRNLLLRALARWTIPRADGVRVVNRREGERCVDYGAPPDRVCVIPLLPDLQRFADDSSPANDPSAWRIRLSLPPDAPVVLWVGRPSPFKNLPMLIRAFARLRQDCPTAILVLGGDLRHSAAPALIEQYGLGDAVRLTGPVAHTDLPALYRAASVYALSSNYEGLAIVLLEASASALPVVTTANFGALDALRDGVTALMVPIGDEAALAGALLRVIGDPQTARRMGQAAREHVLVAFDEGRLLARWMAMWRAMAAGEAPCAS
jgi:glycosyltransferase involved in cell wall biosynthesis